MAVSVCARVVHMGDDTWVKLFPGMFDTSFPFDSFNTKVRQAGRQLVSATIFMSSG